MEIEDETLEPGRAVAARRRAERACRQRRLQQHHQTSAQRRRAAGRYQLLLAAAGRAAERHADLEGLQELHALAPAGALAIPCASARPASTCTPIPITPA